MSGFHKMSSILMPLPALDRAMVKWADQFPDEFLSKTGYCFQGDCITEEGRIRWHLRPVCEEGQTSQIVCRYFRAGEIVSRYHVPLSLMRNPEPFSHVAYSIQFYTPEGQTLEDTLSRGYIGITKRLPIERFKEHEADVRNGGGHLLHSAWRGLLSAGIRFAPSFHVREIAFSQQQVFDIEEELVERFTLSPLGLNVIPGGMAGIRMLHELGALKRAKADIMQRDAALVRLEQNKKGPCAHYRSGHVRKIASDRVTWVRPCWVNLADRLAA